MRPARVINNVRELSLDILMLRTMKTHILFLLAAVVVGGSDGFEFSNYKEWIQWKMEYGKWYFSLKEEFKRYKIWESNKRYVENHNKHAEELGFTLKTNKFADLESDEFLKMYTGHDSCYAEDYEYKYGEPFSTNITVKDLASIDTVDWRDKGYVTHVKNQGRCAADWAFSATGSLEGQFYKATGKLKYLSEQNLIDCSRPQGNCGCEGGLVDQAFEYIIKNKGIACELFYPYRTRDGLCYYWWLLKAARMSNYKYLASGNESELQVAVATVGPISVAVDASKPTFQLYDEGVYYEPDCSGTDLNHAMLVVGYGSDQSDDSCDMNDYWIVKNSWGTNWGMDGYIKMSRNTDNNCGIASNANFPVV